MADNYLQRSHRQDDSQHGNDDPLMELSRIMIDPAGTSDDLALDLERELMGGLDDEAPAAAAPTHAVSSLQQSLQREFSPVQATPPVTAYAEPDYADYEPEDTFPDAEAGEGPEASAQQAGASGEPSLSLEDELENLLAGAAPQVEPTPQPQVTRSANASWGYGSRSNVAGRPEPAPIIARSASQQPAQPAAAEAPVAYQPPPAQLAYSEQPAEEKHQSTAYAAPSAEPAEVDAFDADELAAAFDNFDFSEQETIAEAPAPERQTPEPLQVPVATPVSSAPSVPEVQALNQYADELDRAVAAEPVRSAPVVETVPVTESRVDYTEALDLPKVEYEEDTPVHYAVDDIASEFTEVFGTLEPEPAPAPAPAPAAPIEAAAPAEKPKDDYSEIFSDVFSYNSGQNQSSATAYAAAGAAAAGMAAAASQGARATYQHGPEHDADFGYDPRHDGVDMAAVPPSAATRKTGRSPLFVPGVAAAVILVAVGGAVAYKWVGSGSGEPVVIMADTAPTKVKPETNNAPVVPNQDKAVYDRGATATPEAPKQEQLVTSSEEPVDLAAADDDAGVPIMEKADARIDPIQQDAAENQPAERNSAIAPRKVQTMVVRPDGTMVASINDDAAPANAGPAAAPAERPAAVASSPVQAENDDDAIGALVDSVPSDATPAAPEAAAPAAPVATAPAAPRAAAAAAPKPVQTRKVTPETTAAVAPTNVPLGDRPAEQPLDIVDRVPPKAAAAGQQVASVAPAAGSYVIQIASQPTVEGAQKSYASLSQKFAGVIGGRGVDIRQAEIAGKGTYYRVRIPAGSKSDAINLCSKYKSAGGNCFVTR
ncbi:SPOR domain-containing protein [Phyllobacterium sp. 0TCS1.6C]|uniref:SPOR domain-containing protein n=1 Tax=unclassified Phyllobacterium TaxID=2638441 RepID=UPI0022651D57|nr:MULTISPECIES: SPOR domain-containing protein [unclassified Phyllobacterium]MCX8280807.1 SPOR domain-containing protein [Phyllobacterium sp. 0TCS1.6C]MCX8292616.1 SPOR domain-containing protein [Phyllobacterium sp. 0TCS1.6A]